MSDSSEWVLPPPDDSSSDGFEGEDAWEERLSALDGPGHEVSFGPEVRGEIIPAPISLDVVTAHATVRVAGPRGRLDAPLAACLAYVRGAVAVNEDLEAHPQLLRAVAPCAKLLGSDLWELVPERSRPRAVLRIGGARTTAPDHSTLLAVQLRGLRRWALGPDKSCVMQKEGEALFVPPDVVRSDVLDGVAVDSYALTEASIAPQWAALDAARPRLARLLLDRLPARIRCLLPRLPVDLPPAVVESQDPLYALRRREVLSVAEFRLEVIPRQLPLIICDLPLAPGLGLAFEVLRDELPPALRVPVKLGGRAAGDAAVGDIFEGIEAGRDVYMADVSIANYFPWLFRHFRCPRYGLHCFSHRTRQGNFARDNTPSLFVGAAGSGSALHCDQLSTHFWMFLAEGRKAWTTFHPDDVELLGYEWDEEEQIRRFPPLAELESDPGAREKLHCARRLDFVLEEGELLFIPANTPHQVRNLTRTVSVSANFWDQTNLADALRKLEAKLARSERPALRRLHSALAEVDWPDITDDLTIKDDGHFPDHAGLVDARPMRFQTGS